MDKDNYMIENDTVDSEQLFFKINNKQVVFKTDKRTVEKLDDGMFRDVYNNFQLTFFFLNFGIILIST